LNAIVDDMNVNKNLQKAAYRLCNNSYIWYCFPWNIKFSIDTYRRIYKIQS